jgi:hypothetical protein
MAAKQLSNAKTRKNQGTRRAKLARAGARAFEALERRQLMATVNVADFGAVANDGKDDRGAIQAAIDAAKNGDTVAFNAGQFDVNGQLVLNRDVNLQGTAKNLGKTATTPGMLKKPETTLKFNVSKGTHGSFGERACFGLQLERGAQNVKIDGFNLRSNNGLVRMMEGSKYNSFELTNNDIVWGSDGSYFKRVIVYATVGVNQAKIEHNYMHDSLSSDRNIETYYWSNFSYSYNTWDKVNDGGHILESGDNFKMLYNVGRKVHRMGIEVQGHSQARGVLIEGNVIYDAHLPWNDTFALSVPANDFIQPIIRKNYLAATFDGKWGQGMPGHENRFGYAMEVGGGGANPTESTRGITEENIVIGPWVQYVTSTTKNHLARNNKFYGSPAWGYVSGEPGDYGHGSVIDQNNHKEPGTQNAPPLPEYARTAFDTNGGTPAPGPGPSPTPTPNPDPAPVPQPNPPPTPSEQGITGLKVKVLNETEADITWNAVKGASGYVLTFISTVGRDDMGSVTVKGNKAELENVHRGWEIDVRVTAITKGTDQKKTAMTTFRMPGDGYDWSGSIVPRLRNGSPQPAPLPGQKKRYVTNMDWTRVKNGLGVPEINMSNGGAKTGDGNTLTINGQTFAKGLGVTAGSDIRYDLNGQYQYFCSYIGMDDEQVGKGHVSYEIWGDGERLYKSDVVNAKSRMRKVKVDVQGVKQLWLVVTNAGGATVERHHANWAMPYLLAV